MKCQDIDYTDKLLQYKTFNSWSARKPFFHKFSSYVVFNLTKTTFGAKKTQAEILNISLTVCVTLTGHIQGFASVSHV